MNITKKFRQFAAAAMLLATPAVHAALPYADGDLILGFRATGGQGGTSSYEVNIGSATQFVGASSFTVPLGGNITADLETIYGADWKTRADVFWSISGTQFFTANGFANRTIFASKAQATAGVQSSPWVRASTATQGGTALKVKDMGSPGYSAGTTQNTGTQTESTNSTKGLNQENSASNSYASFMPGGTNSTPGSAFGVYINGSFGIENTFENGTLASVIDLYQLTPGSVGSPATFLGAFRLNDSGVLTYSPNPSDFGSGPANAQVALSSPTYSVQEDGGNAVITLNRTVNTTTAFTVNLSTTDATATSANDYTAQSNVSVSFEANDTMKTVSIPIVDRAGFQGNRVFNVSIVLGTGTATIIQPNAAVVTIVENDPQPATLSLSAATYSVAENVGDAVITVNRSGSSAGTASVTLATAGSSAGEGLDYTGVNTTVNFADSETTKTVNVSIIDLAGYQGDRFFHVTLSNATGASLGTTSSAIVTITEDDPRPIVALSAATFSVSEAAGSLFVNITRSGDTSVPVGVSLSANGGSAVDGLDYETTGDNAGTTFQAGETSKAVEVFIYDRPGFQGSRTFNVSITISNNPASFGIVGTPSTAVVTITDDDSAPGGAVAGNYHGLVKSSTLALDRFGHATMKVTPTGGFSGKIILGGAAHSFSGTFAGNGVGTFKSNTTTLELALKTKPAPTPLGTMTLVIFGDSILGDIRTGGVTVASFTADRAHYNGKTVLVPEALLANKGYFTAVIPSKPQEDSDSDEFPQGDGIATITISKKGTVKTKGVLADGTKFSSAGALSEVNTSVLCALLYKSKGIIAADVKFDTTRPDSDALGRDLVWLRPADANAKHYPAGIVVKLDLLAASYRAPQKLDTASAFPGLGADDLVAGNAILTAADGKLAAPVVKNVNITTKNKVTNAPATDKTFKVSFSAAKGTFAGAFTHSDATKPKFTGIVFQKGPAAGGYGFFLSTKPKIGPTGESGGITLLAK